MHLADAKARSGFRDIPDLKPEDFKWPELESPETAAIWAADPFIGREQALEIALDAEAAGYEYLRKIRDTTTDPEIKVLAKEFTTEESGHVSELKKWIAAHRAGQPAPADPVTDLFDGSGSRMSRLASRKRLFSQRALLIL